MTLMFWKIFLCFYRKDSNSWGGEPSSSSYHGWWKTHSVNFCSLHRHRPTAERLMMIEFKRSWGETRQSGNTKVDSERGFWMWHPFVPCAPWRKSDMYERALFSENTPQDNSGAVIHFIISQKTKIPQYLRRGEVFLPCCFFFNQNCKI